MWKTTPVVLGRNNNYNNSVSIYLTLLPPSGPRICLCSEVAACENTGDNEVDFLTNILQVKSLHVEEGKILLKCFNF